MPLAAGDDFPAFSLPDQDGRERSLADLKGETGLILFIYPQDDTPACAGEATDFRERQEEFRAKGWEIAGLSKDDAKSHRLAIAKYGLTFPLLTDLSGDFLVQIGCYGEKKNYGKTYIGIIRSTFLIEKSGKIRRAYPNTKAKGHAARVLAELR